MASRKAFLVRNLEDVEAHYPANNNALTWIAASGKWMPLAGGGGASTFLDLTDVPAAYATFSGYFVRVSDDETELIFDTVPDAGAGDFLGLTDTPSVYTTFSGYAVQVNSTEDGLEFVAAGGGGGVTSMMAAVNTNWSAVQDAHTEDNTWAYITLCSGIVTTEEDDGIIRCDLNAILKYDDSNWEYFHLRFQLDTPDGTVYSPTMNHQYNSGANNTKYNLESIFFVWSGMPAGDYVMRPQVRLTSNMNCSFFARTGSIRGDWPVEGGGGGGGGASAFTGLTDTPSDYTDDAEKFVKVNAGEDALEFVTVTIPASFPDLDDVPANYTSASGKYVRVNDDEDALIFDDVAGSAATFLALTDVPNDYSGQQGKVAAVNSGENALEFITVAGGVTSFPDLDDVPANYTAASGLGVRVNDDEDALIFEAIVGDFLDLSDVPSSYSGEGGKAVSVKDDETGLEFTTAGGGGGGLLAAFRAQLSAQYNITDDWNVEKLPFDTVDFETAGGYYDETTNYRWTPPAGICNISVITDWTNVNTSNVWAYIFKNGANMAHGRINRYDQSVSIDIWDECNGTDYYEVMVQMGSFSGADVLDNAGTKFSGAVFTAP